MITIQGKTSKPSNPRSTLPLAFLALSGTMILGGLTVGCSTKNYVRSQTAPIVQNINDLDTKTASDHRAIVDTDERATSGINGALAAAAKADDHALSAGDAASRAGKSALDAANRVDTLSGAVANLDQYKSLADVTVTFGFDKSVLTAADKQQLDSVAGSLNTARGYILQVTGGTDTVGSAEYNYQLSQRRADTVVSYLSAKYGIAPHRFYLVGIGKDVQVASDKTQAGRAQNRRVEVQLLSNMTTLNPSAASATSGQR